jgi:hypothetical protein
MDYKHVVYIMYDKRASKHQTVDISQAVYFISYKDKVVTFRLLHTPMYFTGTVTSIMRSQIGQETYVIHDVYQLPEGFDASI